MAAAAQDLAVHATAVIETTAAATAVATHAHAAHATAVAMAADQVDLVVAVEAVAIADDATATPIVAAAVAATKTETFAGEIAIANRSKSMIPNCSKASACWNFIPTVMDSSETPKTITLVTAATPSFPAR